MSQLRDFLSKSAGPPDSRELVSAQWRALSRQVPLMYGMLVCNTLILASTFLDAAPAELTIYIPGALLLFSVFRMLLWWRKRDRPVDFQRARGDLRTLVWVGPCLALVYTGWALSLFPFGDAYQKSQIAFYMSITTIGAMFCLMHVRKAALWMGLCVLGPFIAFSA